MFNGNFMQTALTLIRHRFLWRLIWAYTVCQSSFYGTLGIDGFTATVASSVTSASMLTPKTPRKPASENVVCLCRLLHLLANFSNIHFAYRQTVWTEIRFILRSSLVWVHTVCSNDFYSNWQKTKQTTIVVIGALRVKFSKFVDFSWTTSVNVVWHLITSRDAKLKKTVNYFPHLTRLT